MTPVHPPGPDIDAAIRLLGAVGRLYDLPVDTSAPERRAAGLAEYERDPAEHTAARGGRPDGRPGDRTFI